MAFLDFYDSLEQAIEAYTPWDREAFLKECPRRVAKRLGLLPKVAAQEEAANWQVIAGRTWASQDVQDLIRAIKDPTGSNTKTPFKFSMVTASRPRAMRAPKNKRDALGLCRDRLRWNLLHG